MGKQSSSAKAKSKGSGKKRGWRRFFKLKWLGYLAVLALLAACLGYLIFEIKTETYEEQAAKYDLSKIDDVEVKSLILDRHGREIGRVFVENRDKISIDEVPNTMINALVSAEDQRFFEHDGVDRIGVLRAIWLNLRAGRQTQGASTITQQLARNAFHLKEEANKLGQKGLERKAVEAFLALRIERQYNKREILEFYLNRIPFGSGFYGIRSASLGYFGKEPRELSVSECASLVGCIKNPTRISPLNSLEENRKARNQVLRRLAAEEFISQEESESLQKMPVKVDPKPIRRGTSHLYERIAGAVRAHLGEDALTEGGFKIYTTIDKDVQESMEASLLNQLAEVEAREGYQHPRYEDYRRGQGRPKYVQGAGLMIENDSGAVVAYVGARDFSHNQYDFILSGRKPLGTAFLPFVYTAALEQGKTPVSMLVDRPMDNRAVMLDGREGILGEWGMESFKPEYEGDVTMRRAMEVSKIAATVRLGKELGLGVVMETARKFGLTLPETKLFARMLVGSSAVSLPELVKAYAAYPNLGEQPKGMFFITRVEDRLGGIRYQHSGRSEKKRVTSPQTAFLMHGMLQSALENGTAEGRADIQNPSPSLAGKTGTTYDFADNWFVGYNGHVTCGVWMGFVEGSREPVYPGAFSRDTVMPAWVAAMNTAQRRLKDETIAMPSKIISLDVCVDSGLRSTRYCQEFNRDPLSGVETYNQTTRVEYFLEGSGPSGYCDVHGGFDLPDFKDEPNIAGTISRGPITFAIPIQPKEPLLLGQDPYGTEQPDFIPRDIRFEERRESTANLDQMEMEDNASAITLEKPKRVIIIED